MKPAENPSEDLSTGDPTEQVNELPTYFLMEPEDKQDEDNSLALEASTIEIELCFVHICSFKDSSLSIYLCFEKNAA